MARKAKVAPHLRLRVEPSLLTRLEKSAEKNARTLTGEIVHRLQQSFEADDRIEIFRASMTESFEESRRHSEEFVATLRKQEEETRADVVKMRELLEKQTAKIHKLEQTLRAEATVDILLGENKLKSKLLRSIALELAEAPNDLFSNVASRRQLAERVVSRFEEQ